MAPLRPFPAPSLPPSPTLPILLPPITVLVILLILYIRRPTNIVPTRPMATMKTPLLAGTTRARTRARGHRRIDSYGGIRVSNAPSDEEEYVDGCGKGDGRPARGRTDTKRPRLVRRDDEDILVDTSAPHISKDETVTNTMSDSIPTLLDHQNDHDSSDDQGPSTPDEVVPPIHFRSDRVDKVTMKGVEVDVTEVVETPAEERTPAVGMAVGVVCV